MKAYDILVAGEINPDLILSGDVKPEFDQVEKLTDSALLTIGSSSAIFACGAARLGLKVAFIGVCGEDVFGRFMLDEMEKREVDVSNVILSKNGATGISVILTNGVDRAILTYPGFIPALRVSQIPEALLHQARHLHVASYFLQTALQPGLPDLFRTARQQGVTTSLDTNFDPSGSWAGIAELLPFTNVFLPNRKEVISLTRGDDFWSAAKELGNRVETLAVKLGAEGALGIQAGQMIRVPSLMVKVVDTVGAGDSFDAGFLYGCLHGWRLEKCLQLGCACGGLSTTKTGGTDGQPTMAEAMAYVS